MPLVGFSAGEITVSDQTYETQLYGFLLQKKNNFEHMTQTTKIFLETTFGFTKLPKF